jgi:hypothetical protein
MRYEFGMEMQEKHKETNLCKRMFYSVIMPQEMPRVQYWRVMFVKFFEAVEGVNATIKKTRFHAGVLVYVLYRGKRHHFVDLGASTTPQTKMWGAKNML